MKKEKKGARERDLLGGKPIGKGVSFSARQVWGGVVFTNGSSLRGVCSEGRAAEGHFRPLPKHEWREGKSS